MSATGMVRVLREGMLRHYSSRLEGRSSCHCIDSQYCPFHCNSISPQPSDLPPGSHLH